MSRLPKSRQAACASRGADFFTFPPDERCQTLSSWITIALVHRIRGFRVVVIVTPPFLPLGASDDLLEQLEFLGMMLPQVLFHLGIGQERADVDHQFQEVRGVLPVSPAERALVATRMRGHARLATVHPEVTHIWHSEMNCCLHLPVSFSLAPSAEDRKLPCPDKAVAAGMVARPIVTIEEAVGAIEDMGGSERVKQWLLDVKNGQALAIGQGSEPVTRTNGTRQGSSAALSRRTSDCRIKEWASGVPQTPELR